KTMVVGLLTVEIHVSGSQSLKDKRMVLRRIKDRLKKFNVAVSEVEHQDLWQRAGLAVVTVSTDEPHADRELAAVAEAVARARPDRRRSDNAKDLGARARARRALPAPSDRIAPAAAARTGSEVHLRRIDRRPGSHRTAPQRAARRPDADR